AGQDLRLPIAWFGHPPPVATWLFDNNDITTQLGSQAITTTEPGPPPLVKGSGNGLEQAPCGTSVLTVSKVRRKNTGRYTVQLKNQLGQISSSCNVQVLGEPVVKDYIIFPVQFFLTYLFRELIKM
ncbi:unnamed protein product, partial [Protopolystoma xenopodis]